MRLKPYVPWVILGGTVFFLAKALKEHWQEVAAIRVSATGWATLAIALGVTLLAHIWSGLVWTWILADLNQSVPRSQFIQVYLQTNVAKYIPGNVWHYYGRILAAKTAGISSGTATLSVLLEPLLMAAAALVMTMLSMQSIAASHIVIFQGLPILGAAIVLIAVHPRFLNRAVRAVSHLKAKTTGSSLVESSAFGLAHYPLQPLLGEFGFLGLRSIGFVLILLALTPKWELNGSLLVAPATALSKLNQLSIVLGGFSLAWLLGTIFPVPGGIGIFEATVTTVLAHSFSPALIISASALYRLISILAEAAGAGLAWLDEHLSSIQH